MRDYSIKRPFNENDRCFLFVYLFNSPPKMIKRLIPFRITCNGKRTATRLIEKVSPSAANSGTFAAVSQR